MCRGSGTSTPITRHNHIARKFDIKRARDELRGNLKSGRRILVTVVAGFLIVVGLLGQFVPIFPGKTLLLLGLLMLSLYSPTVQAWVERRVAKYPKLQSRAARLRNRLIHLIHK